MKLSIIVPCYNSELYIERCIKSLVSINSTEVEFVFINDGSTDKTEDIIQTYMNHDSRILIYSKPNGGYSTAINYGIEHSTGEYIMFVGSDDELCSENMNLLLNELDSKVDIIYFTTKIIYDDGVTEIDKETNYTNVGMYLNDLYELTRIIGSDQKIIFNRDTSRIFRKNTIGKTRYFGNIGVSADGCFSSLVASKARSFKFINLIGYIWHLRNNSVSSAPKTIFKLEDELIVWGSFFKSVQVEFKDKPIPLTISRFIWFYWRTYYRITQLNNNYSKEPINDIKRIRRWLLRKKKTQIKEKIYLLLPKIYFSHFLKTRT